MAEQYILPQFRFQRLKPGCVKFSVHGKSALCSIPVVCKVLSAELTGWCAHDWIHAQARDYACFGCRMIGFFLKHERPKGQIPKPVKWQTIDLCLTCSLFHLQVGALIVAPAFQINVPMKQLLTLFTFFAAANAFAQNDLAKVFPISATHYDIGSSVLPNGSGYAVFGNTSGQPNSARDIFMLRLDKDGNELARHIFGLTDRREGVSKGVLPVGNNGFILAGFTAVAPNSSSLVGYLLRIDANGNELWSKTMGGSGVNTMIFSTLTQLPSGDYIAGGQHDNKVSAMRFTANGDLVWAKSYVAGFVYGITRSESANHFFLATRNQVLKIRASDGALQWTKSIEQPTFGDPDGQISVSLEDISAAGNGRFALIGTALNDAIFDFEEAKYASLWKENGEIVWTKVYQRDFTNGTGSTNGTSLIYLPNQKHLLLTGQGNGGMIVTRIDMSGKTVQTNEIPIPNGGYFPILNRNNGVYFATGGSLQGNMNTFFYRSGGNWLPNGILRPEERSVKNPTTPLLYPNPATSMIHLNLHAEEADEVILQVYDASGRLVISSTQNTTPGENLLTIPVEHLPNGSYWLVSPQALFAPRLWLKSCGD